MSAEIINLRRAKKDKRRRDKASKAQQNRALFGMTRAEREKIQDDKVRRERELDGARRQVATGPQPSPITAGDPGSTDHDAES